MQIHDQKGSTRSPLHTGPLSEPRLVRETNFYLRRSHAFTNDICITHGIVEILQPSVSLPSLADLADLNKRQATLVKLGKTDREFAAMARGQALSAGDRDNKELTLLRDGLEIAGRVLEEYRPDLVEEAKLSGKSRHSVRAKVCQRAEDQQIQIMEEALTERDVTSYTMLFWFGELIQLFFQRLSLRGAKNQGEAWP